MISEKYMKKHVETVHQDEAEEDFSEESSSARKQNKKVGYTECDIC
jgi:hypothetical protein